MDFASMDSLAAMASRNAEKLGKRFWGWYTLTAADIREANCDIQSTPLEGNPYHADVTVPVNLDAEDRTDALRETAMDLAARAKFFPWGNWIKEII